MKLETHQNSFDYLIVGAGPAGLQLGYFLEKAGRDYLILEAGETPATSFKQYPRHRQLISINKIYTGYDDVEINLRWDWNSLLSDSEEMLFKNYSTSYLPHADELVNYLQDFAAHFALKIKYNVQVLKIAKDEQFLVLDSNGNVYSSKCLIVATGVSELNIPPIPGIDLAEKYTDVSITPKDFINQRVLIIGKGNSGLETADNLIGVTSLIHVVSPNTISLAWKTKYVGHLRAVNNNFLDTYQLKAQNAILDADVTQIKRRDDGKYVVSFLYTHAQSETEDLVYDRVILCTGFRFQDSIFDLSCKPELAVDGRFPNLTSAWESTNIKDLYFAGVLMHMRDYKKKQSGFIHGFRYNIRTLHHLLEQKYHNQSLPNHSVALEAKTLTETLLHRINTNSGLWQQTGFLCDVIVVPTGSKTARYYQELPVDYVHESELGQSNHYYVITMEFGLDIINASPDPFAVERIHKNDAARAHLSSGIHPIIRRYCRGQLIAEKHLIEDLASEWKREVQVNALEEFFDEQITESSELELLTVI